MAADSKSPDERIVASHPDIASTTVIYNPLYVIPGGELDASFDFPDEEAEVVYQTTAVAEGPESALWLADRNRRIFLGREADSAFVHQFPEIPGWKVIFRSPYEGLPDVRRGEGALTACRSGSFSRWCRRSSTDDGPTGCSRQPSANLREKAKFLCLEGAPVSPENSGRPPERARSDSETFDG